MFLKEILMLSIKSGNLQRVVQNVNLINHKYQEQMLKAQIFMMQEVQLHEHMTENMMR